MLLCTNPNELWQAHDGTVYLHRVRHRPVTRMLVGCQKCEWCRQDRSRSMGDRAMDETRFHAIGSCAFLTVTYSDEFLPAGGSLCLRDAQLFVKQLRKRQSGTPLTVVSKGEYGERSFRPHYHFLMYGLQGLDWGSARLMHGRRPRGVSDPGRNPVYTMPWLEALWGRGFVQLSPVSHATASYVCSYQRKAGFVPPVAVDPTTGEEVPLAAEFIHYPKRPGLGLRFLDKFEEDAWTGLRRPGGAFRGLPRYYREAMKSRDPARFAELRAKERERAADPAVRRRNSAYHRNAARLMAKARGALRRSGVALKARGES